jgi:hypothetical protein
MIFERGSTVGDYKVIGALGSGGMGTVYKVEHLITRRVEAMKVLLSDLTGDSEDVERFVREIQVQARLHHPNIATVYNAFRAGPHFLMVMEYVEGESLEKRMRRGILPLDTGLDYTFQVLRALAYAHREGVVHRDVAPSNIIITPEGTAKLTDFGLARTEGDLRLTGSGAPIGSPWYMSPEQVTGSSAVDPRSDIYSMGAVLSEILTGRKAFNADSAFAVMRAHVETAPEPPSRRNRGVPPCYDAIVLKAMAKEPAGRYQSADEFREALEKAEPWATAHVVARRVRVSRAAVMMVLAPALLAAGLYTAHKYPRRIEKLGRESRRVLVRAAEALPLPDALSPAKAAPEPPKPEPAKVREPASHAARSSRRSGEAPGLRITGGEVSSQGSASPPAPCPRPLPPSNAPAEELEPEPERPAAEARTETARPESEPTTVEAKPQQKNGNRFLRMLGKIVPFRKKDEAK